MDANLLVLIGLVIAAFLVSGLFFLLRKELFKPPIAVLFVAFLLAGTLGPLSLSMQDLGFSNILSGIVWGAAISLTIAALIFTGSRLSVTRRLFIDDRTRQLPKRKLLYRIFIDIPLSTVLLEEIVFRGLVFGFMQQAYGSFEAIVVSSALFGLWHVLPSLTYSEKNDKAPAKIPTIIGTVAFTGLSGVLFALLRLWSGSILAPIALHYAVNTSSIILSWLIGKKS